MLGPFTPYQVFKNDAVFPQFFDGSLSVGLPRGGVALLPVLDRRRCVLDERLRGAAAKPPTRHKCGDRVVDLAHGQLWIFFSAAALARAPRTSNSRWLGSSAA